MALHVQVLNVLNAVFAFVFSPSPLKLIKCIKHLLSSVLVSAMLKFWVLVLNNYKCPNKCVFCCFYGFICDFLEFPKLKSSKIFTAHSTQWDTNFKHEKSRVCKGNFFRFFSNFCLLPLPKNCSYRFTWKTSSD